LFDSCARGGQLFRTRQRRLLSQSKRNREQQRRLAPQDSTYPRPGCSPPAADGSHQHIRIQRSSQRTQRDSPLDKKFRTMAAEEIERFRRDLVIRKSDAHTGDKLTGPQSRGLVLDI